MASGMNGQQFQFNGYLPVSQPERIKKIRELEENSVKQGTQIFIETPYRNNVLLESLLKTCRGSTRLCIAADITGKQEFIKTKTISSWKQEIPDFNKRPVIFLLQASDPGR
jgi:16S rRNA (cytidine1402-2'-O)-methyltransferase